MSEHSWITFPRKIDQSCLRSMVDKSKIIKVKDIETRHDIPDLPDNVIIYRGDSSDLKELGALELKFQITFKNTFVNPFIYELYGEFSWHRITELETILGKIGLSKEDLFYYSSLGRYDLTGRSRVNEYYLREEAKRKLEENDCGELWLVARHRKQLYDLIKYNTISGDVVEIYTEFAKDHYKRKFGPPKETALLNVEEVLTSNSLIQRDRQKLEIRNTGL